MTKKFRGKSYQKIEKKTFVSIKRYLGDAINEIAEMIRNEWPESKKKLWGEKLVYILLFESMRSYRKGMDHVIEATYWLASAEE